MPLSPTSRPKTKYLHSGSRRSTIVSTSSLVQLLRVNTQRFARVLTFALLTRILLDCERGTGPEVSRVILYLLTLLLRFHAGDYLLLADPLNEHSRNRRRPRVLRGVGGSFFEFKSRLVFQILRGPFHIDGLFR